MKAIALILAMFVSLLTAKPGLDAMNAQLASIQSSSCCVVSCGAMADTGQTSDDGDCSGKTCNVFGTCTSCVLQITEASEWKVSVLVDPITLPALSYTSTFSSRYISDCWHPPRFV